MRRFVRVLNQRPLQTVLNSPGIPHKLAAVVLGVLLGQLFVDVPYQRQGIGTEVVLQIIREAAQARQGVKLGVVKTNPALRLYERLGFRITDEDERNFI